MKGQLHIETQADTPCTATVRRCLGDRFEVEGMVGSGGMGVVFRCRDLLDGSLVAVKLLQRREYLAVERFTREAATLAALVHPAIVRYIAHGITSHGEPYLAMEWLDGQTLAERLEAGPVAAKAVARLGARVLQALAAAHAQGIIHRDIKPSNIFLPDGDLEQAKLIDFGIAQRAQDAWQITRPGGAVGTPTYMAPEQFHTGGDVDGRADVFSLGCVLGEALVGEPPRLVARDGDRTFSWEDGSLPRLELAAPPPLRGLLRRMLELAAGERPHDLERLSRQLRQAADALASAADQPSRPDKTITLSGAERRLAAVVAASGIPGEDAGAARFAELASPLCARGAKLECTADGVWAIVLAARAVPGDLVTQAARWALKARAALPGASLAIDITRTDRDDTATLAKAVQQAALLAAAGAPGAIAVDSAAAHLLEDRFDLRTLTEGRCQLLLERDLREVSCTLMGKEIPCFGREREIVFVEDLWHEVCEASTARALILCAPAGGGKSRVRHEVCQRIQGEGRPFVLLLGRGDPMRDAAPFAMLGPAVLAAAGIAGDEPAPVQRDRMRAHVAGVVAADSALRTAAFLGEIANLPFPEDGLPALGAARKDARLMSDQRLTAWLDWLEGVCARHPVLLVLEDLHWADGPSVAFVDAALRVLAQKPFFVLALARPEVDRRFPNLWSSRNPQRIGLAPLSSRASLRMVEHVAGDIPEASARWIVDRAQGSPFFLQELLRVAALGGQVGDDSHLPDTVLGMVQARLDRFGPDAKLVLRAASVFGESFRAAGVRALLDDGARKDVDRWLAILEAQEVVYCRRTGEHQEYAFRHALFRQAAYELLPPDARRVGHLLAGRFLEDSGEPDGGVLADHFERADENAAAVKWLVLAAQQALQANDVGEAVARVERAVRLGAAGEELCQLKLVEARGRFWKGEYEESERAARVALTTGEERTKLLALTALFDALGPQAKYEEIAKNYPVAEPTDTALLNVWLECMESGAAYLARGIDPAYCSGMLDILNVRKNRLDATLAARHEALRAFVARRDGKMMEVILYLGRAAERFRAVGLEMDRYISIGNAGSALCEVGQYEEATTHIREVLAFGLERNLKHFQCGSLGILASIYTCSGRYSDARAVAQRAVEIGSEQNDRRFVGIAESYLSTTEFLAGDYALAERYALDALTILDAVPLLRPFAVALLARALVAQGRVEEALPHAREAFAQLEKMGGVDDGEATIRVALAECLLASGDRDAARDAVASAAGWLRARADKIDHPLYRESFLSRIPEHRRILELARDFAV